MTIWNSIYQNFVDLMTNSSTGIGSLTNIKNTYSEYTNAIQLDKNIQPTSIFNGKFSVQLNGINKINEDIGTGVIDYLYDTKLQLSYKFPANGPRTSYNNAISDIEEIIRKRLDSSTYIVSSATGGIYDINFMSISPFKFINNELEELATVDVFFEIYGRSDLQNP